MPTFTIRDLSEATADAIKLQASAAGLPTEAYVRQLLDAQATQTQPKPAYRLRAYDLNNDGASITLVRDRSGLSGQGARDCSQAQHTAYQQARDLVTRNQSGDRERAIGLLRQVFDEVFES